MSKSIMNIKKKNFKTYIKADKNINRFDENMMSIGNDNNSKII